MGEIEPDVDDVRSVDELARQVARGQRPTYTFFWGHRPDPSGQLGPSCLSQWWPCSFELEGLEFASAEHYMMWSKAILFHDDEVARHVLSTTSAREAKALGRRVRGYRDDIWCDYRWDVVVRGSMAKFGSEPALRNYLLSTEGSILVEASPNDRVWGIGLTAGEEQAGDPAAWPGENLLGFALMEARARLRSEGVRPGDSGTRSSS